MHQTEYLVLLEKYRTDNRSNMCVHTLESFVLKQNKIPCYERGKSMYLANLVKCKSTTALSK